MKFLLFGLMFVASSVTAQTYRPYSLEEFTNLKISSAQCPRIDQWVEWAEAQQRMRGVYGKRPEDLSNEDRLFNLRARALIWSLRIGCANPDRYK